MRIVDELDAEVCNQAVRYQRTNHNNLPHAGTILRLPTGSGVVAFTDHSMRVPFAPQSDGYTQEAISAHTRFRSRLASRNIHSRFPIRVTP
jgi:hypothetical protein